MNSRIGDRDQITIDHVVPLYAGGENTDANKVSCCLKCNRKKSNKGVDDFRALQKLDKFWAERMHARYQERQKEFKPLNANGRQWAHVVSEIDNP